MSDSSAASALAMMLVEDNLRKGRVIVFPSIGVIVTSAMAKNKEGVQPPDIKDVRRAIQTCLHAQYDLLKKTENSIEIESINKTIASLEADLVDPSRYLL